MCIPDIENGPSWEDADFNNCSTKYPVTNELFLLVWFSFCVFYYYWKKKYDEPKGKLTVFRVKIVYFLTDFQLCLSKYFPGKRLRFKDYT